MRASLRSLIPVPAVCCAAICISLSNRAAADLPALTILQSGSQVQLTWPVAATGFVLQTTDQPGPGGLWADIPGSYPVQGSQFVWMNTFPPGRRFFRLAQYGALPTPTGAVTGTVASVGTPWLVTTDTQSPSDGVPGRLALSVPKIVSFPNRDGSIDVAWMDTRTPPRIVITHIIPDAATYKAAWHLKVFTLAHLGGFARDGAGNMYYLTTVAEELTDQPLPAKTQRTNIANLVKLGPLGNELFRTDLKTNVDWPEATPIYSPMTWGTARLAAGGGRVMMTFSCNTEWDPGVNSRHQWHIYMGADALTGVQDMYSSAFGHCWDLRLIHHNGRFIGTSLGDAGLRGIGVADASQPVHRVAFAIKGGEFITDPFYQNTFTRLGDLAPGEAGYGLLFSTEKSTTYDTDGTGNSNTSAVISSRNLAFVHVRSDFDQVPGVEDNQYDVVIADTKTGNPAAQIFDVPIKDYWGTTFAGKNKGLVWLTNYTNRSTENVERPKLVSIGGGKFIAIWEKWSLTSYSGTFAAVIGEYGNVIKAPQSIGTSVRLHRQDSAIQFGSKAAWVTGESSPAKLVLYTLDADLNLGRFVIQ